MMLVLKGLGWFLLILLVLFLLLLFLPVWVEIEVKHDRPGIKVRVLGLPVFRWPPRKKKTGPRGSANTLDEVDSSGSAGRPEGAEPPDSTASPCGGEHPDGEKGSPRGDAAKGAAPSVAGQRPDAAKRPGGEEKRPDAEEKQPGGAKAPPGAGEEKPPAPGGEGGGPGSAGGPPGKGEREEEKEPSPRLQLAFADIVILVRDAAGLTRGVFRALKIRSVRLCLPVCGPDAAETGLRYGRLCAFFSGGFALLQNLLDLQLDKLQLIPDFTGEYRYCRSFYCKIGASPFIIAVAAVRMLVALHKDGLLPGVLKRAPEKKRSRAKKSKENAPETDKKRGPAARPDSGADTGGKK